jgi:Gelsolin repeat
MPMLLPLTGERLVRHGLFLIENGQTIFLWIGRDAVPQLLVDVFDKSSYDQLPLSGKVRRSFAPQATPFIPRFDEAHPTHSSPFHLSTTPSPSASMRLLIISGGYVEDHIGQLCTSCERMAICR